MTSGATKAWTTWLNPNHDWQGKSALAPLAICYRILDVYSWCFGFFGGLATFMIYFRARSELSHAPIYWVAVAVMVLQCASAIFRGLPFRLRYGVLALSLWTLSACTLVMLGVAPNLPFLVILFVSSTLIFFGPRAGWLALGLMVALYAAAAWGWSRGIFPAYFAGPAAARAYVDYTIPAVWFRVMAGMLVMTAALLLIMGYVLKGLNTAIQESHRSLRRLEEEQEHRARAEEARLSAERAAQEAQKFDALGRLASGVAHDINNALCVVKCWQGVLSQESTDPMVREAMAEIRVASDHAGHLTQHLLAFSRTDPVKNETVDLVDAVQREARTLAHLLPKLIEVSTETGKPIHVRLGRGQLQEIILNLALNARDAMPDGGRLIVRVRSESRPARANASIAASVAIMEIQDSGTGMEESVLSRIFEPFFTTKKNGKGTGLGLSMVYGIVTGAGGTIRVQSAPGHGSCFTLEFPACPPENIVAEPRAEVSAEGARCLVLVADDNQEVRSLIGRILQRDGFAVAMAKDGDEAIGHFDLHRPWPGVVILSGVMPGKTTAELIRAIESTDPNCRIVISSGYQPSDSLRRGIDTGRYLLLPKPFEVSQLRLAVNTALGRGST